MAVVSRGLLLPVPGCNSEQAVWKFDQDVLRSLTPAPRYPVPAASAGRLDDRSGHLSYFLIRPLVRNTGHDNSVITRTNVAQGGKAEVLGFNRPKTTEAQLVACGG